MCKETCKTLTDAQDNMLKVAEFELLLIKYILFMHLNTKKKYQECFNSIKREPFKIPVDDGNDFMLTFFNPIKEGWLWKQGGRYKTWKRRWFILNDGCLYYFELTAVIN